MQDILIKYNLEVGILNWKKKVKQLKTQINEHSKSYKTLQTYMAHQFSPILDKFNTNDFIYDSNLVCRGQQNMKLSNLPTITTKLHVVWLFHPFYFH